MLDNCSQNGNSNQENSTSNSTLESLREIVNRLSYCPIAEFMKSKGCDPKNGYKMMIPSHLKDYMKINEDHLPEYVQLSWLINEPVFIKTVDFKFPYKFESDK